MTTLAAYQQPIMQSIHDQDYQLYPFHETPSQSYPSIYPSHHQSQPVSTTFDAYNALYAQCQQPTLPSNVDAVQPKYPHFHSPNYSPANSTAHSFDLQPPVLSSTSDSGASVQSNISSAMGSPAIGVQPVSEWTAFHGLIPGIVQQDSFQPDQYTTSSYDLESLTAPHKPAGFVDPSLISPASFAGSSYFDGVPASPQNYLFPHPSSPAPSAISAHSLNRSTSGPIRSHGTSPYGHQWNPYHTYPTARRQSVSSVQSGESRSSQDTEEKGVCPIASCGRHIKDLKAHLLTHKNERPEKCPIASCEYHLKGFARKYDKNRHTLTHYKGTMVCGFCPGSGSSSEKSFNRADVFKRHLTSVHGVEQTAPNARRKSPGSASSKRGYGVRDVSGTCSTCGVTFINAQEFYEHLDDCVLRVVQQGDPCEAINERILSSIAQDKSVKETLEKHSINAALDFSGPTSYSEEEEEDDDDTDESKGSKGSRKGFSTLANGDDRSLRQGLTHSKGGVTLNGAGKGNKRRKNYPLSWGAAPEKMKMKKRVLCVFDGPRRLWKDDMMLDCDNEVRVTLPGGDGRRWVTDLDVQTLRRAEGLHNATEEEKGPWLDEDGHPMDFEHLLS